MPVNMQELKFKVLEFVRLRGPVIPVQISKHIGSNILFAGAVLSELLSTGKIKISRAKIGGSPVYYFPGQEPRLTMLYGHLNQREKQAFDLLKNSKVLHDRSLQPVERVALREINDFAYSFEVNNDLFWRWYLVNEEEARSVANQAIQEHQKQVIQEAKPELVIEQKPVLQEQPIEIHEQKLPEIRKEEKVEQQTLKVERKEIKQKEPEVRKKIKKETKIKQDFVMMIKDYFDEKNIKIINENVIKKGKEFEYLIEIPSKVGNVRFFLSAKDKKKLSEADLSISHNKSQLKKLPLMILSNGELTKQAKEYLNNNYLIFEKI